MSTISNLGIELNKLNTYDTELLQYALDALDTVADFYGVKDQPSWDTISAELARR